MVPKPRACAEALCDRKTHTRLRGHGSFFLFRAFRQNGLRLVVVGANGKIFQGLLIHFHVEPKRPKFLDQNVDGFGDPGFEIVFAAHDGFVHLRATGNVIGFDREHFLQRIGSAVSFQSPDFHFPESLTAELRLTTQRLLRDK